MTPHLQGLLRRIAHDYGSQAALGVAARLPAVTVHHHVTGQRPVSARHLAQYCDAAALEFKAPLLRAWMRALLPEHVTELLEPSESARVAEVAPDHRPPIHLDPPTEAALRWLAEECANDPELADIIRRLARRIGWHQEP